MSNVAKEMAKKLVSNTAEGIDTKGLYINVQKIDSDIMTVEYQYKSQTKSSVSLTGVMYGGQEKPSGSTKLAGEVTARLASSKKDAKGKCLDAFIVEYAVSNVAGGWGRFLYYILMHYAGSHGITADRVRSSSAAVSVWNKIAADSSVNRLPLDDFYNPATATKDDDCNLASSGIYGEKPVEKEASAAQKEKALHSKDAHDWNRLLRGEEETTQSEETSKEEKAENYKNAKASALNYVYVGESKEAVDMLIQAGMLAINDQFPRKQAVVVGRPTNVPKPLEEQVSLQDVLFGG